MPSSSRRRRHRRRKKPCSPAEESRDWAGLPRDILVDVFLRLGTCREIMRGAERVCTAWRRVAVDEPLLWRRIDLTTIPRRSPSGPAMVRAAVDRSQGRCEAFSGPVDEDSLLYLVQRAPILKSLHISYRKIGSEILKTALEKLTLLEDLETSTSYNSDSLFKSVCQARPHLTKLRVTLPADGTLSYDSYDAEFNNGGLLGFSTMCELRSLELFEFELTTDGLEAVLDNCPELESLYVTGSFYDVDDMSEELELKCARVKSLTLPLGEEEDDYVYYEGDYGYYEDDYSYYGDPRGLELSRHDEFY